MQHQKTPVEALFSGHHRYCIPYYQREYVWSKEDQWERLMEDAVAKAETRILNPDTTKKHFMGAIVVAPVQKKGLIGVQDFMVVDGQQRLSTLQFLLTGIAIALNECGFSKTAGGLETYLRNTNEAQMNDQETERYKVWPTQQDRPPYRVAIAARLLQDLRDAFPDQFTKSGTLLVHNPAPPPAAAIWYFATEAMRWARSRPEGETEEVSNKQIETRLLNLAEATLKDLVIISLILESDDDPQIIFETLNGHGAQLTATDLIRNFLFLTAEHDKADIQKLFNEHWARYDGNWWKEDQKRGRLTAKRLEWFIQALVEAETRDEVELGRVYHEYQQYARSRAPTAIGQLAKMNGYSDLYESMINKDQTPIGRFCWRVQDWDISTVHTMALAVAASNSDSEHQVEMFQILESYLIRRAICGMESKNYNKFFIAALKRMGAASTRITPELLRGSLSGALGEFSRWPRDEEFRKCFLTSKLYEPFPLSAAQMRAILSAIENGMRTERSEDPSYAPQAGAEVDIDHMMPTSWYEHWPLPDGTTVTEIEVKLALEAPPGTEQSDRQRAMVRRASLIPTMGNLTLLHYGTNRAAQNEEFAEKKEKFIEHSTLHINRRFMQSEQWDEVEIAKRSEALLAIAIKVWPGPTVPSDLRI
jgi:hypothetical protein